MTLHMMADKKILSNEENQLLENHVILANRVRELEFLLKGKTVETEVIFYHSLQGSSHVRICKDCASEIKNYYIYCPICGGKIKWK